MNIMSKKHNRSFVFWQNLGFDSVILKQAMKHKPIIEVCRYANSTHFGRNWQWMGNYRVAARVEECVIFITASPYLRRQTIRFQLPLFCLHWRRLSNLLSTYLYVLLTQSIVLYDCYTHTVSVPFLLSFS